MQRTSPSAPEGEEDGDERQCQQLCPGQPRHRYERNDGADAVAKACGQSGWDSPARGPESLETQFCVRVGSHRIQFGTGFGDLRASPGFRPLAS